MEQKTVMQILEDYLTDDSPELRQEVADEIAGAFRETLIADGLAIARKGVIADMQETIADLVGALEAVEWVNLDLEIVNEKWVWRGECPWCEQFQSDGHADDCQRETALAKTKGETP